MKFLALSVLLALAAIPVKADKAALDALLFPKTAKGVVTDGAVIVYKGKVIYEAYGNGYKAESPHCLWSVSKSITGALVGIAEKQGKLKRGDSLCKYLKAYDGTPYCDITLSSLMEWSSGLRWTETYESGKPRLSSVNAMLYGSGRKDMAAFTLTHPQVAAPDTFWMYESGGTTVLMAVLKAVYSPAEYAALPWTGLFDKLGMERVTWERDASGTFIGPTYAYAAPRQLAKLGQLYAANGRWKGEELLPADWVAYSTRVSDGRRRTKPTTPADNWAAGALWWPNVSVPEQGIAKKWKDAPEDTFAALGHYGQYLLVVPSQDLVLVRTGSDQGAELDVNRFLALARELTGG